MIIAQFEPLSIWFTR